MPSASIASGFLSVLPRAAISPAVTYLQNLCWILFSGQEACTFKIAVAKKGYTVSVLVIFRAESCSKVPMGIRVAARANNLDQADRSEMNWPDSPPPNFWT